MIFYEAEAAVFAALGTITIFNLLMQFFQMAAEELKKCSIIREEQKTAKEQKTGCF